MATLSPTSTSFSTQIFDLKKDILKSEINNIKEIADLCSAITQLLGEKPENKEIKTKIEGHNDAIKKRITNYELELKTITQNQGAFCDNLKLPNFGTVDTYESNAAKFSIPTFDNESSTTLMECWSKITDFSEISNLSEKAVKNLLSFSLSGAPYRTYKALREKPLSEILIVLSDRFGSFDELPDYLMRLQNFTRNQNETIASTMQRVSNLLDKTNLTVHKDDRATRYKLEMENYLLKLASPTARKAAIYKRTQAVRNGVTLSYNQLFEIIKEAENLEKESSNSNLPSSNFNINIKDPYILDDMNIMWDNPNYNPDYQYDNEQINESPQSEFNKVKNNIQDSIHNAHLECENNTDEEEVYFKNSLPQKKKKAKKRLLTHSDSTTFY